MNNYYNGKLQMRVPWWHEAGHAVVAMHYGVKVKRIGMDPIPHCIVSQKGLTKHQRGVMYCAGAAMTKLIAGYEWGTHNDYAIASEYGDLEEFKLEALELCSKYVSEAGHFVDALSGVAPSRFEPWYERLTVWHENHAECLAIVERAELPQWQKKLILKWAVLQSRYPKVFSLLARIAY